jgi:iron-sulfur cluster repair protein YtfE (RIC family)
MATFDSVTAYLSWDHRRLEAGLEEADLRVAGARWPEAAAGHAAYQRNLDRHIQLEEEIVFPVFEARSGIVDGPTAVMRDEHRCLRRAVSMMGAAIAVEDAAAYAEARSFLDSVLPGHEAKEERILYPMVDRLLAPPDRATITARLQRE